jgi:Domain of unknown function (DUF4160)
VDFVVAQYAFAIAPYSAWLLDLTVLFKVNSKTNMPTLLIYEGFKFFFYANEHEPKHIHVLKGVDFAKIDLASLL